MSEFIGFTLVIGLVVFAIKKLLKAKSKKPDYVPTLKKLMDDEVSYRSTRGRWSSSKPSTYTGASPTEDTTGQLLRDMMLMDLVLNNHSHTFSSDTTTDSSSSSSNDSSFGGFDSSSSGFDSGSSGFDSGSSGFDSGGFSGGGGFD